MAVKVYTTLSCPYCSMAKTFLKEKGIAFEEVNVAESREGAMEMIRKSGQMGVPVLDINGTIIIGFNEQAIKRALNL